MNSLQINSALRSVLTYVGVWLMARGYVDESAWTSLSGALLGLVSALLVIVPFFYGIWVRRSTGLVSAVAKLPEVASVRTTPDMAAKVDKPNVVAAK